MAAAFLVIAGTFGSINVQGMEGSGSPDPSRGNDLADNTASSLRNPTGSSAVFYGDQLCRPGTAIANGVSRPCNPAVWSHGPAAPASAVGCTNFNLPAGLPGVWNPSASYTGGGPTTVVHGGRPWVAVEDSVGKEPSLSSLYWKPLENVQGAPPILSRPLPHQWNQADFRSCAGSAWNLANGPTPPVNWIDGPCPAAASPVPTATVLIPNPIADPHRACFAATTPAAPSTRCESSPTCIPEMPPFAPPRTPLTLKISSPYYGTPGQPYSGSTGICPTNPPTPAGEPCTFNWRIPNPCAPPSPEMFLVLDTETPGTPIKPGRSPIEHLANLRVLSNQYVAINSVGNTPFSDNPHQIGEGTGLGRYHLDNEAVETQVNTTLGGGAPVPLVANGNPHDVEGAPDKRFALLGQDGYILGRFEQPVIDGVGYDIHVGTAQLGGPLFGTFCLYGATSPNGPFTLVHSAFVLNSVCTPEASFYPPMDTAPAYETRVREEGTGTPGCPEIPITAPPCPPQEDCWYFDLSYFYTPLRTQMGIPNPSRLDYFLAVNSLQHTPYLKTDFRIHPENSNSCHKTDFFLPYNPPAADQWPLSVLGCPRTAPGPFDIPGEVGYPNPIRGAKVGFTDTSVRFGYPMWQNPEGPDPINTQADPIIQWKYVFQSDVCAYSFDDEARPGQDETAGDPVTTPPYFGGVSGPFQLPPEEILDYQHENRDVQHTFNCPGIFPVCHTVHTNHQFIGPAPVVRRQSDPPASDNVPLQLPNPPPTDVLPPRDSLFCKHVTIWNVPPESRFRYDHVAGDPMTFRFTDESLDSDWKMRPAWDYGFHEAEANPAPALVRQYGICPTCPPDGIQFREWDLDDDGTPDYRWDFRGWLVEGVSMDMKPQMSGPFIDDHVGCLVRGHGIQPGTRVLSRTGSSATLSQATLVDASDLRVIVYCPFDPLEHNPTFTYPRPGEYRTTLKICDHDAYVKEGSAIFGSRLAPSGMPGPSPPPVNSVVPDKRGYYGDPYQGINPRNNTPYLSWKSANHVDTFPGVGTGTIDFHTGFNTHACDVGGKIVRIPNNPPRLGNIPPNVVVTSGSVVSFNVTAWDVDPGQTLTLRLCGDQQVFPGMSFPTVGPLPVNQLQQTFTWDMGDLPFGLYGPICFEATDGFVVHRSTDSAHEATRALARIWIVTTTQDTDLDGITDLADNCPGTPNPGQADSDGNGVGDACEDEAIQYQVVLPILPPLPAGVPDADEDGIADHLDNCVDRPNSDQADLDGDGMGDLCDPDADGDGVVNWMDNCPIKANPLQEDSDRNGRGDACMNATPQEIARERGLMGEAVPEKARSATKGLILGTLAGIVAMAAVLVPVLRFALRRNEQE